MEQWEGAVPDIIGWCVYCKEPVREGQGHILIKGEYYHYDIENHLKNCYFPDKEE